MDIKKEIEKLDWEPWLERHFSPFMVSLFAKSNSKKSFAAIGIQDIEVKAQLFQNSKWFFSNSVMEDAADKIPTYLKKGLIFDVTNNLETLKRDSIRRLREISHEDPIDQLKEFYEIMTKVTTNIWLAHVMEHYYKRRLKIVPRYVKGDAQKFIGDASFPKKKNAHVLFNDALLNGTDPKIIIKKYGWLKCRKITDEPFNKQDLSKMAKKTKPHEYPKIPRELQGLFQEVQELVFFRTERTDVFYELIFRARPLFKKVAEHHKIHYDEFDQYTIQSLISKRPKKSGSSICMASYKYRFIFTNSSIVKEKKVTDVNSVKGTPAYIGVVQGRAKIVKTAKDINKVNVGDVLITQMTFPQFIVAMQKACAFVTDEGGITCHAAIIAREMKKPCIIGTKHATKIFNDGDIVEVDANLGIVRKIK